MSGMFGSWWRLRRAWNRLPWSRRFTVWRQAWQGTAAPDRWVALTALGWAHRALFLPWWVAAGGVVVSSAAAGVLTAVFDAVTGGGGRAGVGPAVWAVGVNLLYCAAQLPVRRELAVG